MNTRSRSILPALGRMLVVCAAALLCCALPAPSPAQEKADNAPAVDWSRDTIALNPDGTPATAARQYAVQVALTRDTGSARQIAADLAGRGHDPYILTMADDEGALWHAVRLDIHDSIVAALQSAREFYAKEGVPPSIAQLGSLRGLALENVRFIVQAAAFESEENALSHAADLRSQGLEAGALRRTDDDGAVWNVVYIGVHETFRNAADSADEYREQTDCQCFVVLLADDLLEKSVIPLPEADAPQRSDANNGTAQAENATATPEAEDAQQNATANATIPTQTSKGIPVYNMDHAILPENAALLSNATTLSKADNATNAPR